MSYNTIYGILYIIYYLVWHTPNMALTSAKLTAALQAAPAAALSSPTVLGAKQNRASKGLSDQAVQGLHDKARGRIML